MTDPNQTSDVPAMEWPKCGVCGEMMPDAQALTRHVELEHPQAKEHHPGGAVPPESVPMAQSVEIKKKEADVAKAECGVCGKKFNSGKGLGGHMSKAHPGGKKKEPKAREAAPESRKKYGKYARRSPRREAPAVMTAGTATGDGDGEGHSNGILERLKACAAEHRRQADEIDRQIEAFTESAKKFL